MGDTWPMEEVSPGVFVAVDPETLAAAKAQLARMGAGDGLVERLLKGAILNGKDICNRDLEEAAAHIAALTAQVAEAEREAESRSAMFATACEERDAAVAEAAALREQVARLEGALRGLHHAVCGETGFAACVRLDSGNAYPWPALDAADDAARAILRALDDQREGGRDG